MGSPSGSISPFNNDIIISVLYFHVFNEPLIPNGTFPKQPVEKCFKDKAAGQVLDLV